jgi:hypothetical protein
MTMKPAGSWNRGSLIAIRLVGPRATRARIRLDPLAVAAALMLAATTAPGQDQTEIAKLMAADGAALDRFGTAVSVSGDFAVVGAHLDDHGGLADAGSAYIFQRDVSWTGGWGQIQKLVAEDAFPQDAFGWSVSMSGATAIVGAPFDDDGAGGSGSAYIFQLGHNSATEQWGQVTKLKAGEPGMGDRFGVSVSIDGDRALVGALAGNGSAYVFYRDEGGKDRWGQVTRLAAADGATGHLFGGAVAISGDTAAVGAGFALAAYVFERNHGGADRWGQVTKLTGPDPAAPDNFGSALAIDDDLLIVGAHRSDDECPADPNCNSGAAHVFARNEGGTGSWGRLKKLTASDAAAGDELGISVSIERGIAVVGSWHDDDRGLHAGSAYLFGRDQGGVNHWGEMFKLTASDGGEFDELGRRVSFDGDTIIIGAWRNDEVAEIGGAAYVFCPCLADLDCDGRVGLGDLLDLLAAWGGDPGGPPDIDGDGRVGIADLLTMLANWGPCL